MRLVTDPAVVLERLRDAPPLLGTTRLLCIDGPAGSGKTTLANQVAALSGARVLRMDDLYPGWSGLFSVDPHVLGILEPLAAGQPGRYRRYDWPTDAYAEEHVVDPTDLLILEGVGSGNRRWSAWSRLLVWVETNAEVRLERGLARDGAEVREHWMAWMADEQRLFTAERTRDRADLVLLT